MKILLLGGSGVISHDVARCAVSKGHEVFLLNRGIHPARIKEGCCLIKANLRDSKDVRSSIGSQRFDVVVDFLSFNPEQLKQTFLNFKDHCSQYIFISSATVYCKTGKGVLKTENTPATNTYWDYATSKKDCEDELRILCGNGLVKYTIVRPYITYGDTRIPFGVVPNGAHWTLAHRILTGKPVVLWDGGRSLCTLTHSTDFAKGFVGLFDNPLAMNNEFHITSDEIVSWREVVELIAQKLGRKAVIADISSAFIISQMPELRGLLLGDRSTDMIFDNSKIKSVVPDFICTVNNKAGIRKTIEFFKSNPEMMKVDYQWDARMDRLVRKYYKRNDPSKLKELNLSFEPSTGNNVRNFLRYFKFKNNLDNIGSFYKKYLRQ